MASLARNLRPLLRCIRSQTRAYADAPASGNEMKFVLAGGNQVFYDQVVIKQVDVPSFSGSFGILPKHVPTLAVLQPGVVTVYETDGQTKKVFVSSGTITVNEDSSVQIIAEEAHPLENFDASKVQELLSQARQELASASSDVDKAKAAIAVEVAEALEKAVK